MSANLVEDTQCSPDKKPADTQVCYNVPCGSRWFAEDWTQVKCKNKEAAIEGVLQGKIVLKILQNSKENTCIRASFLIMFKA